MQAWLASIDHAWMDIGVDWCSKLFHLQSANSALNLQQSQSQKHFTIKEGRYIEIIAMLSVYLQR